MKINLPENSSCHNWLNSLHLDSDPNGTTHGQLPGQLLDEPPKSQTRAQMLHTSHPLTNPRGVQFLCHHAQEGDDKMTLQDALDKTARTFRRQKSISLSAVGVRAQVLYHLNAKNISSSYVADTLVMMAHYAFYHENLAVYLMRGDPYKYQQDGQWDHWQPIPTFPTCSEDPLLALMMGGFCLSHERDCAGYMGSYPLSVGDRSHMNLTSAAACILVNSWDAYNQTQSCRIVAPNRVLLEDIACMAIMNASRVSGIGGCTAFDFIRGVVIELQPLAWSLICANPEKLSQWWSQVEELRIPFVARTESDKHASFPVNSNISGLHVGVIFRPENSEC